MGGRRFLIIGRGVFGIDFLLYSSLMTSVLHHIPSFFPTLV